MPKPPPEPERPAAVRSTRTATKASPVTRRRTPSAAAQPAPAARRRLRTHQDDFKPWILGALQDLGGEAGAETVIELVEERMAGVLLPGDRELGPQGEPRWRTALRWARKELADEELLLAPRPGVWQLTERGEALPSEFVARPDAAAADAAEPDETGAED